MTAARPWSTNGKWEKIIQETNFDKVLRMAQNTKDPRDTPVGKPPTTVINPYPRPAESPQYIDICPGYKHKKLFNYMREKVAELYLQFKI